VAVTGAGSGIGRALCLALAREGAMQIAVIDINETHANAVAHDCGGKAYRCDVTDESALAQTLTHIESEQGALDLFCSNAGIARMDAIKGDAASAPNRDWEASWQINVMQHVYAARVLVPKMRGRGGGRFLITASAAGLLTQLGGAPYAVTKHAAIGFAEMLAITHAKDGIGVSVLCPQGVETPLLHSIPAGPERVDGVLSAETVALAIIEGLRKETFLILPHEKVTRYMQAKTADYDRWIRGMIKLGQRLNENAGR
jgi:NAD(P)-dependent dehydrogenase (short-subunit alcohol dehydrogenase family)